VSPRFAKNFYEVLSQVFGENPGISHHLKYIFHKEQKFYPLVKHVW
jgi:hypothetical protein